MADATPNYRLERKKIQVQIGQLTQNMLASELREMQLEAELEQIQQTLAATAKAIEEQEATLASLPDA